MSELTTTNPNQLLQIAIEKGVDMPQLEKFMDLHDRWETKEANKAFSGAMAEFQGNLPPIAKTKQGHNCKYADIDDIATAVRPVLEKAGLSYRFEQQQAESNITVTCIVTHISGHQESTTLTAPADASGGKNDIQAIASAVTYLRRYTLTGALGITTGLDECINRRLFEMFPELKEGKEVVIHLVDKFPEEDEPPTKPINLIKP